MTSVVLLLLTSVSAQAASVTDIAAKSFGRVSKDFVRHVDFSLEQDVDVETVVFGHKEYGFFRTKSFKRSAAKLSLSFVPPGYRFPIDFFTESKLGRKQKLGTIQPKSPIGKAFAHLEVQKVTGHLSPPYLALVGALPFVNLDFSPPEYLGNAAFVYVINRLGEVVWIHFPDEGRTSVRRSIELGSVDGHSLSLYAARDGIFEVVDFSGEVGQRTFAASLLPQSKWRKGFVYDRERGLFVASETPFFERQWPSFWLPPRKSEAAVIQKVDLGAERIGTVWSNLNHDWPPLGSPRRKEKVASLESVGKEGFVATLMPSGNIYKIDESMQLVLSRWRPRNLESYPSGNGGVELLHAASTDLGLVAFYSDGEVWKCDGACRGDSAFKPWIRLPTGINLARGRVVWQQGDTIAFYGIQAPFHSFRRRTVRPDLYWEWNLEKNRLKTEWEVPQLYYSAAEGALALKHLSIQQ